MQPVFNLEAAIWLPFHGRYRSVPLPPVLMPVLRETWLDIPEGAIEIAFREAFRDLAFQFPSHHLESMRAILDEPCSSDNDRFVARSLLENAVIARNGTFPTCQDSGSAQIFAWKGQSIRSRREEEAISRGVASAYADFFLRKSILIPKTMTDESNTGTNLPAQIEINAGTSDAFRFLCVAKGGGSSNKTALFQETKVLLSDEAMKRFLKEKIAALGASACPPYWICVVVGGLSPEYNLKIQKLASSGALDGLPMEGEGAEIFRCPEWERFVTETATNTGIGAQFGGTSMILEARVLRLPRHTASLHVSIGVSCCAHRAIRGFIDKDGISLEALELHPERFLEKPVREANTIVSIDLNQPMEGILTALSACEAGERISLSGPLVVARDAAHARFKALIEEGLPLPGYLMRHPIYYAGPSDTPPNEIIGSLGPTTAERMDAYADDLMPRGASLVTLAKGNRTEAFRETCSRFGGIYLGTIGGAAALLASCHVTSHAIIDYPDLGMEAVRLITVKDLPCFVLIDARGTDFYATMVGPKNDQS